MIRWDHQISGVGGVRGSIARGYNRICLTSPTGMGKTTMVADLIEGWLGEEHLVSLYTNRNLLRDQISDNLRKHGLDHGTRAAGHGHTDNPFQVSSIQTEVRRLKKDPEWKLHPATRVVVDEGHLFGGDTYRAVLDRHVQEGGVYVLVTATPIGLGSVCDDLVVAGNNTQGRACGALVPAVHYGCDEPDLRKIRNKIIEGEDIPSTEVRKVMMVPGIFARVLEWYGKLNPDRRPAILFAPDVASSIWFAEQFHEAGISAAHIDGTDVWIDGELMKSTSELRQQILDGSRDGRIKVITNRFVLREGIDAPWLVHGIFATVFGALQSLLQSGGRLLRAMSGKDSAIIQDHGGNWWRHGSLNADREWDLGLTGPMISGLRAERLRAKQDHEPARCPQCSKILMGAKCSCGFTLGGKRSRMVFEADGSLREMAGDVFKPRVVKLKPDTEKLWKTAYFRARNGNMTFRQARGLFIQENGYAPPETIALMPTTQLDWFRKVKEVPRTELR